MASLADRQRVTLEHLVRAAKAVGMSNAELWYFVATSYVESSWDYMAVGDGGTSFGPFQHHIGGAGGPTSASAKRYHNPQLAANERARAFKAARVASGRAAAAVQRPANRSAYAREVDAVAQQIRTGTLPALTSLAAGAKESAKRGTVTGDTGGLNPALLDALKLVAGELGKPIRVVSGKRSRAEQEELYARYLAGTGNLAAKPGTSKHESGDAADAYVGSVPLQQAAGAIAAKHGIGFPVPGEAWHAELTRRTSSTQNVGLDLPGFDLPGLPGLPGADDVKDAAGDVGKAIIDATDFVIENLIFITILGVGLLLAAALAAGGTWRALGETKSGSAAQGLATAAATRGASKATTKGAPA